MNQITPLKFLSLLLAELSLKPRYVSHPKIEVITLNIPDNCSKLSWPSGVYKLWMVDGKMRAYYLSRGDYMWTKITPFFLFNDFFSVHPKLQKFAVFNLDLFKA